MVGHVSFMHNTVTNDAHILKAKGIHSPSIKQMFAYARNPRQKTELWFRTPEKLEAWQQHTDMDGWFVKVLRPNMKHEAEQEAGETLYQ